MITKFGTRSAAIIAGVALFAGFVPPVSAAAPVCTFYRDLTVGVTGSDVVCLQTYLITSGFSIPAGATGYFGSQTQGATAAWQAAHGVTPPAGYFGPISRAEYATLVAGGSGGGNGGGGSGAATLSNFNLVSEDSNVKENETNDEIARAQFTVNGGNVSVSRVDLEFQAGDTSESVQPWDYFRSVAIYDGSNRIGSVTASDESDWTKNGGTGSRPTYLISVDVNDTITGGRSAALSVQLNTLNSIDNGNNGQEFTVDVPDQGIHATDSRNTQLRAGDDRDTVSFHVNGGNGGVNAKGTGDTAVLQYDESNTSHSYGTFTLKFDITANGSDVYVPHSISTDPGSSAGVIYDPDMDDSATGDVSASLTSSADTDSGSYVIHEGDTEHFTATITIDPSSAGYYQVGLSALQFSLRLNGQLTELNVDQNNSQYHTDPLYIPN